MVSRENYKDFCKSFPEIKITFGDWMGVIYTFNRSFRDYMLETGATATLFYGFGPFCIKKKKIKRFKILPNGEERINLPIDWYETKKAGKYIYHMNAHSEGYSFSWIWMPRKARFKYSSIWRFKPSRETSRIIKQYVTKPDSYYKHLYQEKTK